MNRPDIEGIRERIDGCNQVVYETWGAQSEDAENDMEKLLAYITDLERERDNAWDKYAEVCLEKADLEQRLNAWREGNGSCLARIEELKRQYAEKMGQRLAQAEKVVEAAKPFADGGIEVFTASDGYPAMRERDSSSLRAALAEWEGE